MGTKTPEENGQGDPAPSNSNGNGKSNGNGNDDRASGRPMEAPKPRVEKKGKLRMKQVETQIDQKLPRYTQIRSRGSHHPYFGNSQIEKLLAKVSLMDAVNEGDYQGFGAGRGKEGREPGKEAPSGMDLDGGDAKASEYKDYYDNHQYRHHDQAEMVHDRFGFTLNHLVTQYNIQVFFDVNHLLEPPDLLIDASLVQKGFRLKLGELESYMNWDGRDEENLAKLIQEVYGKIQSFEKELVGKVKNDWLAFQLSCLSNETHLFAYLYQREGYIQKIFIGAPLRVKVLTEEKIPEVTLLMEFTLTTSLEDSKPKVEGRLLMDNVWHHRLGNYKPKALGSDETILDYFEITEAQVSRKLQDYFDGQQKRKALFDSIVKEHSSCLLECDPKTFKYIVLMFECKVQFVAVKIDIPSGFPDEKPEICLFSLVDGLNLASSAAGIGSPKKKALVLKGYDGKWSDEELFKRIMAAIMEGVKEMGG